MQIVIDISDKAYGLLKYFEKSLGLNDKKDSNDDLKTALMRAVINGTPLPKGHGRLIDADKTALLSNLFCYTRYTGIDEAPYEDATKALDFAPTIIEADKAEGSDKE